MAEVGEFDRLDEPVTKVDVIDNAVDEEDEEMNDLFGDDDDDDNVQVQQTSKKRHMNIDANSDDENEEDDMEDDEEVPFDKEPVTEAELTVKNITLARHPRSHNPASGLSFPLPRFLSVNADPFHPMEFEDQIKTLAKESNNESLKGSLQFKKLELTNTIRWRYAKAANGSLHKQSNTQIIEWEDGSKSLKIGKEYFDMKLKDNDDDILAFTNADSLMAMLPLNQSVQIVPPSTTSQAHKLLAMTIKSGMKNKKAKKINTIVTNQDPEAKAREVEKAQREIEKARRRQLQKAEMEEAEMERNREPVSYSRTTVTGGEEEDDDEEDDDDYGEGGGFVVGDEEDVESEMDDDELDKAAEKLKQVKRDGASKYRESEEGDDDETGVVRKKRRVVLDDEEDSE